MDDVVATGKSLRHNLRSFLAANPVITERNIPVIVVVLFATATGEQLLREAIICGMGTNIDLRVCERIEAGLRALVTAELGRQKVRRSAPIVLSAPCAARGSTKSARSVTVIWACCLFFLKRFRTTLYRSFTRKQRDRNGGIRCSRGRSISCLFSRGSRFAATALIRHDDRAGGGEHAADAVADRDPGVGDLGGGAARIWRALSCKLLP